MAHLLAPSTSYQIIHRLHTSQPSSLHFLGGQNHQKMQVKKAYNSPDITQKRKWITYCLTEKCHHFLPFLESLTILSLFVQVLLIRIFQPCNFLYYPFCEGNQSIASFIKVNLREEQEVKALAFLGSDFYWPSSKSSSTHTKRKGFLWPTQKAKKKPEP